LAYGISKNLPECHLARKIRIDGKGLTANIPTRVRTLLGLEPLTPEMLTLVSAAVLLTWSVAEAYSRIAQPPHHVQVDSRNRTFS
jgi:hypothetical protein